MTDSTTTTRARRVRALSAAPLCALALGAPLLWAAPAQAAPDKPLSEIRVDVIADQRPVMEVLRQLERDHGLNYVVSQRVLEQAGQVNVHLRDVPLEDALHAICIACGLKLQIRGRILVLLPMSQAPAVPAPVRRPRNEELPRERRPRVETPPAAPRDFSSRPAPRSGDLARSVGIVVAVDVEKRHLRLDAEGLKLDFYAPTPQEAGDASLAARLRAGLARLQPGHKVALEYRTTKGRFLIQSLVGGTEVRDNQLALIRPKPGTGVKPLPPKEGPRAQEPRAERPPRTGVTGPRNPLQAPESTDAIPDGVLAGSFVGFKGETAQVKRGDGEVVDIHLPQDADLRAKILEVVEKLEPGVKVFFMYEGRDGKMIFKSTGITAVRPNSGK